MNEQRKSSPVSTALAICALAFALPGAALAADHLLSINGTAVTTPATINGATGALTQALVLTSFDGVTLLPLGQSQSVTIVRRPVKLCKPGTNQQLEWLDQGNAAIGVNGTLTSGNSATVPLNGYRLTLTTTVTSDTYASSNGPCTVSGQRTYAATLAAVIDKQTGNSGNFTNKLTNTFNFWNVPVNGVPEPGTMLLVLAALAGLGWMGKKRGRALRGGVAR